MQPDKVEALVEKIITTLHESGVCPCNIDPILYAEALSICAVTLAKFTEETRAHTN